MPENNKKEITIADLYPELSPDQQMQAKENWLRYLAVVRRIFERLYEENPEILTELERMAMLRKKKSAIFKSKKAKNKE